MLDHSSFIALLRLLQIHCRISELVLSSLVDRINPHLVQINKEDNIITEASDSMQHGHLNHKREHIINKCIEGLINHGVNGNMSHALELIVNKQLRGHRNESYIPHRSLSLLPNRYTKFVSEVMIQSYHDLCVS